MTDTTTLGCLKDLQALSGQLLPLPTVQELLPSHDEDEAYVAEIDIKSANKVVKLLDTRFPRDPAVSLAYLRRFAKPEHLPDHLQTRPRETEDGSSGGKSNRAKTIHILISPPLPDRSELEALLAPHAVTSITSESDSTTDNEESRPSKLQLRTTKIPLQPPISLEQSQEWSRIYWPTTYNPAAQPASHAPPPMILRQTQASIQPDAGFYLALARKVAKEAEQSGRGRGVGAVVVDPQILESKQDDPLAAVVAVAGDARYHDSAHDRDSFASSAEPASRDVPYDPDHEGQPSDHALMRVVSIVSRKRLSASCSSSSDSPSTTTDTTPVALESQPPPPPQTPTPAPAPDPLTPPLSPLESHFFHQTNLSSASSGGYLCTSLDLYITHEPCLCCSMGMLLSRFRSITVGKRVKGGVSAALDAEKGYGLHWRRELNWRAIGFEFVEEEGGEDVGGGESAGDGKEGGDGVGFEFHA